MIRQEVTITGPDGPTDGWITKPDTTEPLPGIIQITDIFGLRPAQEVVAQKIAEHGYILFTPNIFYRTAKPPVFDFEVDFGSERTKNRFQEITSPLTAEAMALDGSAYVDFLASQASVSSGPMGVVGFCFGGKFAVRIAAARPDRIGAAASFHGGGLVTAESDSPHLLLPQVKSSLYFGHAENDRSMPAEAIDQLDSALKNWGGNFQSEVYEGAGHGWMIEGREVYNPVQAARGFEKLIALFDVNLKSAAPVR